MKKNGKETNTHTHKKSILTFSESIQNNKKDLILAARKAIAGHRKKYEVRKFEKNFDSEIERLMMALRDGSWEKIVCEYREWIGKNPSPGGKIRLFREPSLRCRILQHLLIRVLMPWYIAHDNYNALNCKVGCGILSTQNNRARHRNNKKFIKSIGSYDPGLDLNNNNNNQIIPGRKRRSVLSRLKHIFYDRRDLHWALVIDQRQCYMHIRPKLLRKTLRDVLGISWDPKFLHFALMTVYGKSPSQGGLYRNAGLPIGTPTSPLAHHLCMFTFDRWVVSGDLCAFPHASVRYADDNLIAFQSKKDANEAKWRIYNYWWYVLGVRAKTCTARIINLDKTDSSQGLDFCGFVYHRNPNRNGICQHNKGFVRLRKNTRERIMQRTRDFNIRSFASYFGRLICADEWKTIRMLGRNGNEWMSGLISARYRRYDSLNGHSYRFMPFGMIWKYYGCTKNGVSILDYDPLLGKCVLEFYFSPRRRPRILLTHLCADNSVHEKKLIYFLQKFQQQYDYKNNYKLPLWNIPSLKRIS